MHTGHGWTSLSPADGSSDYNQRGACCKIDVDMYSPVGESERTFLAITSMYQCITWIYLTLSCFLAYFAVAVTQFQDETEKHQDKS